MPESKRLLKIFISYASQDKTVVQELSKRLASERWIDPWVDEKKLLPGQDWRAKIEEAVESSDSVIICLSNNSVTKEGFVQKELRYAREIALEKPEDTIFIIPLRLDECDVPRGLRFYQWADYFAEKKDETYKALVESLKLRYEQKILHENKERVRHEEEKQEREATEKIAREIADKISREKREQDRLEQQKVEERKKAWVKTLRKINFKPILTFGGIIIAVFILFFVGRLILDNLPASPIPTMTVTSQMTVSVPTPTETQSLPTNTLEPPTVTPTPALGIGSTQVSDKDGMTLLYVPAGEFTMGSNDSGYTNQKPAHTVYLDAFWIDQTEVTNAMYTKCVDVGKCTPPSNTNHFANVSYANHPVNSISSWSNASAYCTWVGRKLPTEAEWEKAARGTDGRIYPWGNDAPNSDLLNYNGEIGETTEVKKYANGVSPYGAYDMAGNVWEYVSDLFSNTYYQDSPASNPLGPDSGQYRVLRGGSWYHLDIDDTHLVRSTFRLRITQGDVFGTVGFRCASSP